MSLVPECDGRINTQGASHRRDRRRQRHQDDRSDDGDIGRGVDGTQARSVSEGWLGGRESEKRGRESSIESGTSRVMRPQASSYGFALIRAGSR